MAQVSVDLSEYDMLRDAKKNAEETVEQLKAEIEEYKKNARVIVTTKKCFRMLDANKVANEAARIYLQMHSLGGTFMNPYFDMEARIKYESSRNKSLLKEAIAQAVRSCDIPEIYQPLGMGTLDKIVSSTEVKGFEDVRLKVEELLNNEYKTELDTKLAEAKASKEKFDDAYKKVSKTVKQDYEAQLAMELEKIKSEYADKELHWKQVERDTDECRRLEDKLKEENTTLRSDISDLREANSKMENYKASAKAFEKENLRLENQVSELQHKLEIANAKLNCKHHWWNFI